MTASTTDTATLDTRPNILLITADQWRGDFLGSAGHRCQTGPAGRRSCWHCRRTPAADRKSLQGQLLYYLTIEIGMTQCSV
jgi:arylsulfatase A-like enzyme